MVTIGAVYRDGTEGMRAELRELLDLRLRELEELPASYRKVYARRCGRAAAGAVAAVGGVVMFTAAIGAALDHGWFFSMPTASGALTQLLWLSWLAAFVAYFVARSWSATRFDGRLSERFALTGVLHTDLDIARHLSPRRAAADVADDAERWSLGLPLVGLALLMPLSLHYLGAAVLERSWPEAVGFDEWIVASTVLVGHCHVILAIQSWLFAKRMDRKTTDQLITGAHKQGWSAWGWTVASSAVPGAMLFGIPVFLVAITGFFIPIAFSGMTSKVQRERVALV